MFVDIYHMLIVYSSDNSTSSKQFQCNITPSHWHLILTLMWICQYKWQMFILAYLCRCHRGWGSSMTQWTVPTGIKEQETFTFISRQRGTVTGPIAGPIIVWIWCALHCFMELTLPARGRCGRLSRRTCGMRPCACPGPWWSSSPFQQSSSWKPKSRSLTQGLQALMVGVSLLLSALLQRHRDYKDMQTVRNSWHRYSKRPMHRSDYIVSWRNCCVHCK